MDSLICFKLEMGVVAQCELQFEVHEKLVEVFQLEVVLFEDAKTFIIVNAMLLVLYLCDATSLASVNPEGSYTSEFELKQLFLQCFNPAFIIRVNQSVLVVGIGLTTVKGFHVVEMRLFPYLISTKEDFKYPQNLGHQVVMWTELVNFLDGTNDDQHPQKFLIHQASIILVANCIEKSLVLLALVRLPEIDAVTLCLNLSNRHLN
ncbi:hypothetical protein Tco_0298573 [Tanacetum coccineum]